MHKDTPASGRTMNIGADDVALDPTGGTLRAMQERTDALEERGKAELDVKAFGIGYLYKDVRLDPQSLVVLFACSNPNEESPHD